MRSLFATLYVIGQQEEQVANPHRVFVISQALNKYSVIYFSQGFHEVGTLTTHILWMRKQKLEFKWLSKVSEPWESWDLKKAGQHQSLTS